MIILRVNCMLLLSLLLLFSCQMNNKMICYCWLHLCAVPNCLIVVDPFFRPICPAENFHCQMQRKESSTNKKTCALVTWWHKENSAEKAHMQKCTKDWHKMNYSRSHETTTFHLFGPWCTIRSIYAVNDFCNSFRLFKHFFFPGSFRFRPDVPFIRVYCGQCQEHPKIGPLSMHHKMVKYA